MMSGRLIRTAYACILSFSLVGSSLIGLPSKAAAAGTEAYHWANVATGAGGGFVPGIIYNETQPNLIYARTDIGGLPLESGDGQLGFHLGFGRLGGLE